MFLKDLISKHNERAEEKGYTILESSPYGSDRFGDAQEGYWFHYRADAVLKNGTHCSPVIEIFKIKPIESGGIIYNAIDISDGQLYHLEDDLLGVC